MPCGDVEAVLKVSTDEPDPAAAIARDGMLKLPVVPLGNPATAKSTFPENPFSEVTVAVYEVVLPRLMFLDPGETATEKSPGPVPTHRTRSTFAPASVALVPESLYRSVKYSPSGPAANPAAVAFPVPVYSTSVVGPLVRAPVESSANSLTSFP